ncbi:DNA-binding protein, partial [Vibrio lentus]
MWFIASELAGVVGFPSTGRRARDLLKKLAMSNPELERKRQGTKATEYHVSLLPVPTQTALLKQQGKVQIGDQVLELPKKKSEKSYCREALWARWSKNNNAAKEKAQQALRTVQAVFALKNNGIKLMDAY